MSSNKMDILVYVHSIGMIAPSYIGILTAHQAKGRKIFSFEYTTEWLNSKQAFMLDPEIGLFTGAQFPVGKDLFGIFMDSMPDTWGRTLMKRRAVLKAREEPRATARLYDIDFLLGVYDESRMGALRFKLKEDGPFLDDNKEFPTPPWSSIRELQHAATNIELGGSVDNVQKWLAILMSPGSSLGGARPKANILDDSGHPWIAKFPSKNDTIDMAKWEFLAYQLAISVGIMMAESKIESIAGGYSTFFTKRFDRINGERVHFASAMTMTGNDENTIKDESPSYLDLAEFIQFFCKENKHDLHQLWRRMVFNIAISNTDDHLRNHGFIHIDGGWRLSPAYDVNPSIDKVGLALNIDQNDNALDFELAKSVGKYFQLEEKQMNEILNEILTGVGKWKTLANSIRISRSEQQLMESTFRC